MNPQSTTRTLARSFGPRLRAFPLRATLSQLLSFLLLLQTCMPPSPVSPRPPRRFRARRRGGARAADAKPPRRARPRGESLVAARVAAPQSFGIVLSPLSTDFGDHAGLDHHQSAGKLVLTANTPAGQPHSFELIAADGAHAPFSNVAGLAGEVRNRRRARRRAGAELRGLRAGRVVRGRAAPGVIARVSADGAAVQNPWVTLPGENGLVGRSLR